MRGPAGSLPEISVFPTEISVNGLKILPYEHFIPVTRMNGEMNSGSPDGIVLHCLLYFPHISIPFNCSDTALRVSDGKIGPKVKIFVSRHVFFVSRIWRQNSFSGSLTCSHLGNRAEISLMNPRQNSSW